jgi:hypothetical protein
VNADIGKGNKHGTATVTVADESGNTPGSEYTVSGRFGGSFDPTIPYSGATTNGAVTFTSDDWDKGVTVTFCISAVSGSDPYEPADNGPGVTICGDLPPDPVCPNNVAETGEVCDGTDLNGETCLSQGYGDGTLACNETCSGFIYEACSPPPSCVPTHNNEKGPRCSDDIDNDCDGLIDNEDPDC